jgi:hypothetical protein
MKCSSKSLFAVKAATSRSTDLNRTGCRAATARPCAHEEALISLVRLMAQQAARECNEKRSLADPVTSTSSEREM